MERDHESLDAWERGAITIEIGTGEYGYDVKDANAPVIQGAQFTARSYTHATVGRDGGAWYEIALSTIHLAAIYIPLHAAWDKDDWKAAVEAVELRREILQEDEDAPA